MAFKFVVLFSILAAVNAGHLGAYYTPTVQKTIEYAAPVAKTIEYAAPVHKAIYQPSPVYAKTLFEPEPYNYHAHASPAYAHSAYDHSGYGHSAYGHSAYAPSAYAAHGTISHHGKTIATPHSYVSKYDTRYVNEDPHYYPSTIVKTPIVPAVTKVISPVPTVVKSYDHAYDHAYDHSYAHGAPVVKAAVAYSPAVAVSHATFESAHGHYAW